MIAAIRAQVSHEEAEQIVASAAPGWTVRFEQQLYYPYYWFHLRHSTRTLLGTSAVRISCLVDARRRVGATADTFELDYLAADTSEMLDPRVDEDEAFRIAERYTAYVIRRQRKALATARMEVLEKESVYKPFSIVSCEQDGESPFRVLVDSVTGGFQPLSSKRAKNVSALGAMEGCQS